MEPRENYLASILQDPALLQFQEIKFLHASQALTSPAIRLRCMLTCAQTRQSALSPPFTPTADETRQVLDEYRYGLMIRGEMPTDGKDFRRAWSDFAGNALHFERECFIRGYHRAFALAIGNCLFGHHDDSLRPCDFPHKSRPTFEALGIDLSAALELCHWAHYLTRDPGEPLSMFAYILIE